MMVVAVEGGKSAPHPPLPDATTRPPDAVLVHRCLSE